MPKSERFARVLVKRTNIPGLSATTSPSDDHTILPEWGTTDIYEGEFFVNLSDEKLWIRTQHGVKRVLFEGDVTTLLTNDVSNPPTLSELNIILGSASSVENGYTIYIDDNGAGSNFYQIVSDGSNWWIFSGSKAT